MLAGAAPVSEPLPWSSQLLSLSARATWKDPRSTGPRDPPSQAHSLINLLLQLPLGAAFCEQRGLCTRSRLRSASACVSAMRWLLLSCGHARKRAERLRGPCRSKPASGNVGHFRGAVGMAPVHSAELAERLREQLGH